MIWKGGRKYSIDVNCQVRDDDLSHNPIQMDLLQDQTQKNILQEELIGLHKFNENSPLLLFKESLKGLACDKLSEEWAKRFSGGSYYYEREGDILLEKMIENGCRFN